MTTGIHSPAQLTELCCQAGAAKVKKSISYLLLLSVLAGAFVALASAATNTAVYGIVDVWTIRTICALIFPFGLGMVVVLGGELFTGNCLIPAAVLNHQATLRGMLRNWGLVYLGNFLGAALVAWLCVFCGQLNYSGGQLAVYTMKVAIAKSSLSFAGGLGLGFLCNILVCAGVLMATAATDVTGKLLGAFLPVCFFALCGFEHCVANMYYITAGLLAAEVPAYAALAAQAGLDLTALTPAGLITNLVPTTLGNILGGAGLGILMWYSHMKQGGTHE